MSTYLAARLSACLPPAGAGVLTMKSLILVRFRGMSLRVLVSRRACYIQYVNNNKIMYLREVSEIDVLCREVYVRAYLVVEAQHDALAILTGPGCTA